jgi:hypothetical protein
MKGTGLEDLQLEYLSVLDNIGKTKLILRNKEETVTDLKAAKTEAEAMVAAAQEIDYQRQQLMQLKGELVWAQIEAREKVL